MINCITYSNNIEIVENEEVIAEAYFYWDKLPTIFNGKIDINKKLRQIYITGVLSNKIGYGSILMQHLISHLNTFTKVRKGYSRDIVWLRVEKSNERAFCLYKKFGFELDTVQFDDVYFWMFKKLKTQ